MMNGYCFMHLTFYSIANTYNIIRILYKTYICYITYAMCKYVKMSSRTLYFMLTCMHQMHCTNMYYSDLNIGHSPADQCIVE